MSNVTELELSVIRTDGGTQPRAELNSALIEEYARAMAARVVFPPITVFYDKTHYWLADGFHRVEAAKKIGSSTIRADVNQGSLRQAVLHSVGVNATHGLRRSNEDKRRAVQTLLRDPEWSQWSDREIARQAGVSDRFVNNLSKQLTANGSQSTRRRGADGRIINTINIGKSTSGLVDKNQSKSSSEEIEAPLDEEVSLSQSISLDSQRQLPSALTIDVKAEVVEDDEESSVPTKTPPASTHQSQPELLIKPPELEPPEASGSELGPELEQAGESVAKQEANTLLDFEVGNHIHIERSQNKRYNDQPANVVRVNSSHKTLTLPVEGSPHRNTVSLPIQRCTKVEAPASFQFEVGDRVRILRRQQGKDNWAGKTARIWQLTSDGWLRVDVEGYKGVKFTLKPNWVEPMPEVTPEQHNEQPEPVLDEGWADEPDPESPAMVSDRPTPFGQQATAIADIPLKAQSQGEAHPQFQAGDRLQVTNLGQQNQQWSGEVAEVLQVADNHIKVIVEISQPPE